MTDEPVTVVSLGVVACSCSKCRAACSNKPGWFAPGDAERAADLLGVSLPELFQTYLAVDWHEDVPGVTGDVFVLSPAVVSGTPGEMFGADPSGRCRFLSADGQCRIHGAKPRECREYHHTNDRMTTYLRHIDVAREWVGHQAQVRELLGREPMSEVWDDCDGDGD